MVTAIATTCQLRNHPRTAVPSMRYLLFCVTFPISQGVGYPGSTLDHFGTNLLTTRYNLDTFPSLLSDHKGLILSISSGPPATQTPPRTHVNWNSAVAEARTALSQVVEPTLTRIHQILLEAVESNTRLRLNLNRSTRAGVP